MDISPHNRKGCVMVKPKKQRRKYVTIDKWVEYEQRKRRIAATAASSEEYEARIKMLCEELGI